MHFQPALHAERRGEQADRPGSGDQPYSPAAISLSVPHTPAARPSTSR
ncbi:hypothetical protein OG320_29925 [Microbispora sp. NBC_01189]|nr:hypothetical protein OG320_29925 [Microbispora sp. NBC_01189]